MDWTYVTNNHDKYLDGEEIVYEIEEKAVEGYETYYDGYNITNVIIVIEEIHPPHTDCDDYVNTLDLVNHNWYDLSGNGKYGVPSYDYSNYGFVYDISEKMASRWINNGLMLGEGHTMTIAPANNTLNLDKYYTLELLIKFNVLIN